MIIFRVKWGKPNFFFFFPFLAWWKWRWDMQVKQSKWRGERADLQPEEFNLQVISPQILQIYIPIRYLCTCLSRCAVLYVLDGASLIKKNAFRKTASDFVPRNDFNYFLVKANRCKYTNSGWKSVIPTKKVALSFFLSYCFNFLFLKKPL